MNGIDISIAKDRNIPSTNLAETTNRHLNNSTTPKIPSFTKSCQAPVILLAVNHKFHNINGNLLQITNHGKPFPK